MEQQYYERSLEARVYRELYFPLWWKENSAWLNEKSKNEPWASFCGKYHQALWDDFCNGFHKLCEGEQSREVVHDPPSVNKAKSNKVYFKVNPKFNENIFCYHLFGRFLQTVG